jgi:hypothetical protein
MLLDNNIVSTSTAYFDKIGISEEQIDWDATGDVNLISLKEYKAISEIIACQVSFWCLRRLGNSCQSNSEAMRDILYQKIRFYEDTFGKNYQDFNEDLIW